MRLLRSKVVILAGRFRRHFTRHAGNLVQQIAQQLDRTVANTPVVVKETQLQFGQQKHDGSVGVHVDNALAGAQGRVSDKLILVGERLQDRRNNLANVRREFILEHSGQVDEHGDVTILEID